MRLDLHRIAPFLEFLLLVRLLAPALGDFRNLELAAPHCAAGFRVRLNFHGRSPFAWNVFLLSHCQALLGNASGVPKVTSQFMLVT